MVCTLLKASEKKMNPEQIHHQAVYDAKETNLFLFISKQEKVQ